MTAGERQERDRQGSPFGGAPQGEIGMVPKGIEAKQPRTLTIREQLAEILAEAQTIEAMLRDTQSALDGSSDPARGCEVEEAGKSPTVLSLVIALRSTMRNIKGNTEAILEQV